MLKHEAMISSIRFYKTDTIDYYTKYDAICNVVWETEEVIWLNGFHGEINRKLLREFLLWLVTNKIKTVKAYRSPEHILPLAKKTEEGYFVIEVQDLTERFMKGTNG